MALYAAVAAVVAGMMLVVAGVIVRGLFLPGVVLIGLSMLGFVIAGVLELLARHTPEAGA